MTSAAPTATKRVTQTHRTRAASTSGPSSLGLTQQKPSELSFLFPSEPAPGGASSLSYYANPRTRPTMAAYLSQIAQEEEEAEIQKNEAGSEDKFGWFDGVMGRCLLGIFGVVLFLRLPQIVGNVGTIQATIITLCSVSVTGCTALSLSAIATNGRIGSGGVYYMISRSLGPAWGGAIGIMFFAANAISVSMYVIGFVESLQSLVGIDITGNTLNDIRLIGFGVLCLLMVIVLVGVSWVVKTDMILLAVLIASIISIFIGAPTGYEGAELALKENLSPYDDASALSFMTALGIFFPAVTGIMAGANLSGSLKDPSHDIPKGTILAVGSSALVYIALIWLVGAFVSKADAVDTTNFVMASISVFKPLVYGGVFAASLSSALSMLVSAPRVLQALARDNIMPMLHPFAKVLLYLHICVYLCVCVSPYSLRAGASTPTPLNQHQKQEVVAAAKAEEVPQMEQTVVVPPKKKKASKTEPLALYRTLAHCLKAISETTKRLEKQHLLASHFAALFRLESMPELIAPTAYLCASSIAPAFAGVEFGLGDVQIRQAMADAFYMKVTAINSKAKKLGDLGLVAEELRSKQRTLSAFMAAPQPITVPGLLKKFREIASASGTGAML
ncbi:hypothetical protein KIPB_006726 [Kipferlia bialata]|uniref:Amino acid permease/ SLC12A domain-containing protein n=1 Tax=Kipferlia bialata TaxID=797122 RepID=A0A9K3CZM0_9EUKA|nr:hypothetical protein KIPB_006726 [Kipferlia bialata]|eukprot:g6726.t1